MQRDEATFDSLIEGIYAAVLDPERWHRLLPEILSFANAPRGTLGVVTSSTPELHVLLTHELDPALARVWVDEFQGWDPVIARCGVPLAGTVFRAWDVVPADEYRSLDLHRRCFGPAGVDDQLITTLTSSGDRGTYLSAFRGRGEGPFSDDDARAYAALAPHLARASCIQRRLLALSGQGADPPITAEPLGFAALLVDERGTVLALNEEARRMAASGGALRVRAGRVSSEAPEVERGLQGALAFALGNASGAARASVLHAPRPAPEGPLQIVVAPISGGAPESVLGLSTRRAAALVVVSDPGATERPRAEVFTRLFGLSPGLATLASALVAGRTLLEYAREARVSEPVARDRLTELFQRTETSQPAELVETLRSAVAQLRVHGI
jgi:hypothetical protein